MLNWCVDRPGNLYCFVNCLLSFSHLVLKIHLYDIRNKWLTSTTISTAWLANYVYDAYDFLLCYLVWQIVLLTCQKCGFYSNWIMIVYMRKHTRGYGLVTSLIPNQMHYRRHRSHRAIRSLHTSIYLCANASLFNTCLTFSHKTNTDIHTMVFNVLRLEFTL